MILQKFSSTDRKILIVAGVFVTLALLGLYYDNQLFGLAEKAFTQKVGEIVVIRNEARTKAFQRYAFKAARSGQSVHIGDSVFTGDQSYAQIQLEQGGQVDLAEDSLVFFGEADKENLMHFDNGNFRLQLDGKVKLAIQGEVYSLEGHGSDVQVFVSSNKKPQIKILKGHPQVTKQDPIPEARAIASETVTSTTLLPAPAAPHVWSLYDLYQPQGVYLSDKEPDAELAKTSIFWPDAKPFIEAGDVRATLQESMVTIPVQLQSSMEVKGYVVEASTTADFQKLKSHNFWTDQAQIGLQFYHAGAYYYRFRAVGLSQELSDWSQVQRFDIESPPVQLAQAPADKTILRKIAQATEIHLPEKTAEPAQTASTPEAEPMSIQKLTQIPQPAINKCFGDNHVEFQGGLLTADSRLQAAEGSSAPQASEMGVEAIHWWDRNGLEGILQSQVSGLNQEGQNLSTKDFELRAHHRFSLKRLWPFSQPPQLSLFGGYKDHQNSSSHSAFASNYNLIEFGTAVVVPLLDRWSLDAELVYGLGLSNNAHGYSSSAQVNYYLRRDWSFGLGFDLNLFDGGSATNAGVAIKEANAGAFGLLRYYY